MKHIVRWMQEGGSRCKACFSSGTCHECSRPILHPDGTLAAGRWFHSHTCYDAWCWRAEKFKREGYVDACEMADLSSLANRRGIEIEDEPEPARRAITLNGKMDAGWRRN